MADQIPEKIRLRARKSKLLAVFLGFFLSPLAYVYIGKYTLAIVNFITFNYFFFGFFIVPVHVWASIKAAEAEVNQ